MKASLFTLLVLVSSLCRADLVVIAHAESGIPEVSQNVIKSLYMGSIKNLNGQRVLPLDQMQGNDERNMFYSQTFDIPMNQILAHWSRLIFTGKGQSPIQVSDSEAVYQLVKNNKNMIGYIPFENVTPEVRVIFRVRQAD